MGFITRQLYFGGWLALGGWAPEIPINSGQDLPKSHISAELLKSHGARFADMKQRRLRLHARQIKHQNAGISLEYIGAHLQKNVGI